MDVKPVKADEFRGYEAARMREFIDEARTELATVRMDIYQAPTANLKRVNVIKKNLARALTVRSEQSVKRPSAAKKKGS